MSDRGVPAAAGGKAERPARGGCKPLAAVIALLMFLAVVPVPVPAAEPVSVVVEGLEGEVLENVREALALPSGLVRAGTVDRLWLERFGRQAEEAVRMALEPYGYYDARIVVTIEEGGSGEHRYASRR